MRSHTYCFAIALLTVAALLLPQQAVAWSTAMAVSEASEGKDWAWAKSRTQQEANETAIRLCNEATPERDCVLHSIKTLVRAEGVGRIGYGASITSIEDAKQRALAQCRNPDCKVTKVMSEPGFVSLAKSEESAAGHSIFHAIYAGHDAERSDADALLKCKERSGRKCTLVLSTNIEGTLVADPEPEAPPSLPTTSADTDCRPKTSTIRCTSDCVNGNCVVTYENGCKVHVQVSPRFDGFRNSWVYPSPSC